MAVAWHLTARTVLQSPDFLPQPYPHRGKAVNTIQALCKREKGQYNNVFSGLKII